MRIALGRKVGEGGRRGSATRAENGDAVLNNGPGNAARSAAAASFNVAGPTIPYLIQSGRLASVANVSKRHCSASTVSLDSSRCCSGIECVAT